MSGTQVIDTFMVDLDGDVILVLGNCEIYVSSKLLSLTSSVFKAMLSTIFAEGNQVVATGELKRISLPDDDGTAIMAICSILHYNFNLTPELDDPGELETLGITAYKYDFIKAMQFWSHKFLTNTVTTLLNCDLTGRLLYPTWALDVSSPFAEVTKNIILFHGGKRKRDFYAPLKYGIPVNIKGLIPDGLLATLRAKERKLKNELQTNLEGIIQGLLHKAPLNGNPLRGSAYSDGNSHHQSYISECDCNTITMYFKAFSSLGLWPLATALENLTLSEILDGLEKGDFWAYAEKRKGCGACDLNIPHKVREIVRKTRKACIGLCLDCVNYGEPGKAKEGVCRLIHTGYLGLETDE